MARQIIALEVYQGQPGYQSVKVAFWFPVVTAKQYPKPTFQSAVDTTLATPKSGQVTAAELTALQSGAILEEVQVFTFAASETTLQIKADLQQAYTDRAAAIALLPNPIAFYGVSFDGTVWSA